MYPSLRTRRLTLRPLEITDAPRLREIFVNSDVMENLNANTPWPYPDDESEKFVRKSLENWGASGEMVWAILLNHEEPPIGLITLRPKAIRDHRGFWLGRDYWGQGLMKEAVLAVTDYAFDVVGMKEMILSNSELNLGSTRIKQLSGTVEIGREPRDYHTGPGVAVYYRLTADSWRANRHRMA